MNIIATLVVPCAEVLIIYIYIYFPFLLISIFVSSVLSHRSSPEVARSYSNKQTTTKNPHQKLYLPYVYQAVQQQHQQHPTQHNTHSDHTTTVHSLLTVAGQAVAKK